MYNRFELSRRKRSNSDHHQFTLFPVRRLLSSILVFVTSAASVVYYYVRCCSRTSLVFARRVVVVQFRRKIPSSSRVRASLCSGERFLSLFIYSFFFFFFFRFIPTNRNYYRTVQIRRPSSGIVHTRNIGNGLIWARWIRPSTIRPYKFCNHGRAQIPVSTRAFVFFPPLTHSNHYNPRSKKLC